MKKKIAIILMLALTMVTFTGCASCNRALTDLKSDISGGLQRTLTVYTADGDVLAWYTGKIDLESNEGGYVKFDLNGKRYIYYNCFVECVGDI